MRHREQASNVASGYGKIQATKIDADARTEKEETTNTDTSLKKGAS